MFRGGCRGGPAPFPRGGGISLRFSNVYGPFCAHKNSVVAAFLRRALRRQPFIVHGSGRQTRDFLYVDDVTAAIRKTLSSRRGWVYQLGTGDQTSVLKLARLIADACAVPLQIARRPARPGEEELRGTLEPAPASVGSRPHP